MPFDKRKNIPTTTKPMTTKLGKVLTYSHSQSYIISICIRPIATKHGKIMTHREGLPPIDSHNPLNMFS